MPHIAFTPKPTEVPCKNVVVMAKLRYRDDTDNQLVAPADLIPLTEAQPDGYRAIQLVCQYPRNPDHTYWWLDTDSEGKPLPSCERYRREHAETLREWWGEYKRLGGRCDYAILDFELSLDHHSVLTSRADIEEVLTRSECRWLTSQLGLMDFTNFRNWGGRRDQRELIFNRRMHDYTADVLNDVFYKPIAEQFPGVKAANYDHTHYSNHIRAGNHRRYSLCWTDSNGSRVGTHGGMPFYGGASTASNPWSADSTRLNSPWEAFKQMVTWGKSVALGSMVARAPWMAWVSGYYQTPLENEPDFLLNQTPYWSEMIRHLATNGCREFVLWHRKPIKPGAQELSDVLRECDDNLPEARYPDTRGLFSLGLPNSLVVSSCGPEMLSEGSGISRVSWEGPSRVGSWWKA